MSPRGEENFAKFGWVAALSWLTLSFAKFSRFVRGEVIEGSSLGAGSEVGSTARTQAATIQVKIAPGLPAACLLITLDAPGKAIL